jgi:3-hydroxyisobutyrate dehydrogenase-like beta-hydroxyacid dehydrogenase
VTGLQERPTVGILYPGEMGSSLGRILSGAGLRVVTTLQGRGPRTQRLCREAGLEVVASLGEVVRLADVVVSVVPPWAALQVAREYAALAGMSVAGRVYVDANAIAPATAVAVGQVLTEVGIDFVDAAINGSAARLGSGAAVYLSGTRAVEVAQLLGKCLQVQVVGDVPGKASALKGALAGLSKGLAALFVEIGVLAQEAGVADVFLERCRAFYPGIMEVVDRMLPTYPQHARRRAEEMAELDEAMRALGLQPDMVQAAGRVTRAMAEAGLPEPPAAPVWTADRVLQALHACGALRARPTP